MNHPSESGEPFCRSAWKPVQSSGMRPGYDCRCSGCMQSLGQAMDPAVLREMARQARSA
jgi:hypothetical protein